MQLLIHLSTRISFSTATNLNVNTPNDFIFNGCRPNRLSSKLIWLSSEILESTLEWGRAFIGLSIDSQWRRHRGVPSVRIMWLIIWEQKHTLSIGSASGHWFVHDEGSADDKGRHQGHLDIVNMEAMGFDIMSHWIVSITECLCVCMVNVSVECKDIYFSFVRGTEWSYISVIIVFLSLDSFVSKPHLWHRR